MSQEVALRDQYGVKIKKGFVFGYLCVGRAAGDRRIYRFGKTTKTEFDVLHLDEKERTKVMVERLGGFSGLNKPEHIILWEPVDHVDHAWDLTRHYIRKKFKREQQFGDKYYSADGKTAPELEKQLQGAFAVVLQTVRGL